MFKALFYFFGVFAIMYEIWSIKNSAKLIGFREKIVEATKVPMDKKSEEEKDFMIKGCIFICFHILYLFWAFVGVFSSQWIIFLAMIALGLIGGIKALKKSEEWNIIDALISIFLVLFAILNTYHFHIDVPEAIFSFFLD